MLRSLLALKSDIEPFFYTHWDCLEFLEDINRAGNTPVNSFPTLGISLIDIFYFILLFLLPG